MVRYGSDNNIAVSAKCLAVDQQGSTVAACSPINNHGLCKTKLRQIAELLVSLEQLLVNVMA